MFYFIQIVSFIFLFVNLYKTQQIIDSILPFSLLQHDDIWSYQLSISFENINKTVNIRQRKLESLNSEMVPLYPGFGTHFVYVYVGTPPQRQSVIVDTGSHITAFPCIGCQDCGGHTDPYYDYNNSSTYSIPKCSNHRCEISQSYVEGSSWRAFQIIDKFFLGSANINLIKSLSNAFQYSVDFKFACQISETGLFRSQKADGIMGMSMNEGTLPYVLYNQQITNSKVFGLCFRIGGGIMTIGGYDSSIHSEDISYAKLQNTHSRSGWFGVMLLDISLIHQNNTNYNNMNSLHITSNTIGSRGCIIDSGTTDSYFPKSFANIFNNAFQKFTGMIYTTNALNIPSEILLQLPTVVLTFLGINNDKIYLTIPWTSYTDNVSYLFHMNYI